MGEHTPGPWGLTLPDFDYSFEQYHEPECERDPDAGMAKVSSKGWSNFATVAVCVNGEPDAEGRANAHLIAAAPDLLSACVAAEAALGDLGAELAQTPAYASYFGSKGHGFAVLKQLIRAIHAAKGTPLPPAGPPP